MFSCLWRHHCTENLGKTSNHQRLLIIKSQINRFEYTRKVHFISRMEPLVTNKKVLVLLCVCPPDKSMSIGNRAICVIFALVVFILNASVVQVHFSYFLTFLSINLAESLYALMYGIAFCAPVYGMISTLFVRNEFGGIFKQLSAIYRNSKCFHTFTQQPVSYNHTCLQSIFLVHHITIKMRNALHFDFWHKRIS